MKHISQFKNIAFYPVINEKTGLLPVYCCGIGINPLQEERNRPEGFPKHHMFIVLQGSGRLFCEGQETEAREGSCFLIEKGVPHRYCANGSVFQTGWLTFDGYGCEALFAYAGVCRFRFQPLADPELSERFREFCRRMQDHLSEQETTILLYDYIHRFLSHLTQPSTGRAVPLAASVEYIRTHYQEDITLDELASVCGMSRSAFCRSFKSAFHETPFEYVQRIRVTAAKKLLVEQPAWNIQHISELTGFHDAGYFCRTFRRFEGMSPGAFRRVAVH